MMQERKNLLESGELWQRVLIATRRGLASGALQHMPTNCETLAQDGVVFSVRVLSNITRKKAITLEAKTRGSAVEDPFLPYDEALFVSELTETHLCLLNKFNVVDHHVLIVTRAFEEQRKLLTMEDFEALCLCMAEYESLGFYNGGPVAGASQSHKHLQLVPLPLFAVRSGTLVDELLPQVPRSGRAHPIAAFQFQHLLATFAPDVWSTPFKAAEVAFRLYRESLRRLGLLGSGGRQKKPYNLLLSRKWMLVVPRSQECFGTISVNALGFAGALLVRNTEELELLRAAGPMTALQHVGIPREER